METQTTLAEAIELCYPYVSPEDPTSQRVIDYINKATRRLLNSGKYLGSLTRTVFRTGAIDGKITLPPHQFSIEGVCKQIGENATVGGGRWAAPLPVWSSFHEYIETGPGKLDETLPWCQGGLIDDQDGHVTVRDIVTPSALKFELSDNADAGITVTVGGTYEDGQPVSVNGDFGVPVVLSYPISQTSQHFQTFDYFVKPRTQGTITVYAQIDGAWVPLVTYLPWETVPSYHRYKTGKTARVITVLCKRRFTPAVEPSDPVIPGNPSALEEAVKSLVLADAYDYANSATAWQAALGWLDQEARSNRGAARYVQPWMPWGDRIPNIGWSH